MDPVLQALQQQTGGSANGEGFGRDYATGYQLSLSKRHMQVQEAENLRQQEAHPYMQQLREYQTINKGLELGTVLGDSALATKMNSFIPEIQKLKLYFMSSPKGFSDSTGIQKYQELYSQNPWAFSAGVGAEIKQGMDAQWMQQHNWIERLEKDAELRKKGLFIKDMNLKTGQMEVGELFNGEDGAGGPEVRTITDPESGTQVKVYRTGSRSWGRVPDRLDAPKASTVIDPQTKNPMTYVQTGPNSFSRVPLSTGQQQLEQTGIAADNLFEQGRQLLPLINDRTTSPEANIKRVLRDSPVGVFMPKSFLPSAEVTEADATAREFLSQVVRGLRSDGNITGGEAKDLMTEANAVRWVDERTGKTRVKTFIQGAVRKARESSLKLGRPINEKYLTLDEIGQRAESKLEAGDFGNDPEAREKAMDWATRAYQNSAQSLIESIDNQIGR